jgi:hypothetical protein
VTFFVLVLCFDDDADLAEGRKYGSYEIGIIGVDGALNTFLQRVSILGVIIGLREIDSRCTKLESKLFG